MLFANDPSLKSTSADLLRPCAWVFRTCHKPTVRFLGFQVSGFAVTRPLDCTRERYVLRPPRITNSLGTEGYDNGGYYWNHRPIKHNRCVPPLPNCADGRLVQQYTHDLNQLPRLSGLTTQLDIDKITNPALEANWAVVKDWNEESRYKISGLSGKDIYKALLGPDGVLTWIKKYW